MLSGRDWSNLSKTATEGSRTTRLVKMIDQHYYNRKNGRLEQLVLPGLESYVLSGIHSSTAFRMEVI